MSERRQRRHPGIDKGTLRPDRKQARRESAATRQTAWDALSNAEKVAKKESEGHVGEAALLREKGVK